MSLKLKDEDSTKRMKDMQEELKDPSLGEFSDLEQIHMSLNPKGQLQSISLFINRMESFHLQQIEIHIFCQRKNKHESLEKI